MARKVRFSQKNLNFSSIVDHHIDIQNALKEYYIVSYKNDMLPTKFLGYTKDELQNEYKKRVSELENSTIFMILSSLEASFRIDYLTRIYCKAKDPLSRKFRLIYKDALLSLSL